MPKLLIFSLISLILVSFPARTEILGIDDDKIDLEENKVPKIQKPKKQFEELPEKDSEEYLPKLEKRALKYYGLRFFLEACNDFLELMVAGQESNLKKNILKDAFLRCAEISETQTNIEKSRKYLEIFLKFSRKNKDSDRVLAGILRAEVWKEIKEGKSANSLAKKLREAKALRNKNPISIQIAKSLNDFGKSLVEKKEFEKAKEYFLLSKEVEPSNSVADQQLTIIWRETNLYQMIGIGSIALIFLYLLNNFLKRRKMKQALVEEDF